jgi:hypothetical protein
MPGKKEILKRKMTNLDKFASFPTILTAFHTYSDKKARR